MKSKRQSTVVGLRRDSSPAGGTGKVALASVPVKTPKKNPAANNEKPSRPPRKQYTIAGSAILLNSSIAIAAEWRRHNLVAITGTQR